MSDLFQWLLEHYGQEQFQPGLGRIRFALQDILPTLSQKKIITIAGTNGKGETTLWLSRLIKETPHCVWISPHIERITERFQSEEGEIPLEKLKSLILACHKKVQEQGYQLSFYEFLFFAFCHWAQESNCEVLLLEVGLGGRMDAVNVLDADLVLLPSISRDHQEFLGKRLDQILGEKLALVRPGKELYTYLSGQYLREKTDSLVSGKITHLEELELYPSSDFSKRNQLLAYAASCWLRKESFDPGKFHPEDQTLEHRGDRLKNHHDWIFYGSHNVDGMRKLILFLHSENYTFSRIPFHAVIAAFSKRDRRDLAVMMKMLKSSKMGKVYVTSFEHPKAADRALVMDLAQQEGLTFVDDPIPQLQLEESGTVLVLGSYYFMGDLKHRLLR
jgi:folylpolyglutamate synthase/dihydropteroate synthase